MLTRGAALIFLIAILGAEYESLWAKNRELARQLERVSASEAFWNKQADEWQRSNFEKLELLNKCVEAVASCNDSH